MKSTLVLAALGCLAWVSLPAQHAEARSCEAIAGSVTAASQAADTNALIALYEESESAAPACTDRYRVCLGRAVAHGYVDRAYAAYDARQPMRQIEGLLEEANRWSQTWKVLLAFAELADEQKRYDEAARYYQAALNDLADNVVCEGEEAGAPDAEGLRSIFNRAQVAGLLADKFVEPPADRNNDPGGIFLPSVRGISPVERSLPVEFEYDSSALTPKGIQAAEALAGYIVRNLARYDVVRLAGHTDARGAEGYNCRLSAQRLDAIASFLYAHGVPGEVAVELIPQGEFQPIPLDNPGRYSEEEVHQLNRRVALVEDLGQIERACQ